MCQCTAGNKINADLTDLLDIFFCDVSGAFCLCSSVDQFNCLFHYFRCHVVEHDDVCSCLYCFFDLIQSLYLDLDLAIRYGLFYIQEDQMVLGYQKINRTQITRACRCHLRPVNIKFGISLSWLT